MDWVQIHLLLNHFPIVLAAMGALSAIVATIMKRRGIWMYAAVSLTLAGIMVIPAYLTGGPAEVVTRRPPSLAPDAIGAHQAAALVSAALVGVAALVGAFAWRRMVRYPRETSLPASLRAALLVSSLAAAGHLYYTALLGTRVVHGPDAVGGPAPVDRGGPVVPPSTPSTSPSVVSPSVADSTPTPVTPPMGTP